MKNYRYIPFPKLRQMYKRRRGIIEAVGTMAVLIPGWCLVVLWILF